MIKAVATDIDRTLTISGNNYKLTVEAVKAIRVLEEHGIPVILISGNSLPIVVGLRDISGPVLGENGCVIFYKGRKYYVTREMAKTLPKLFMKNLKATLFTHGKIAIENLTYVKNTLKTLHSLYQK